MKKRAPKKPLADPSTAMLQINLTGNRCVCIDITELSDRGHKDVIGICVTHSQEPETLLENLKRVPGVTGAWIDRSMDDFE